MVLQHMGNKVWEDGGFGQGLGVWDTKGCPTPLSQPQSPALFPGDDDRITELQRLEETSKIT